MVALGIPRFKCLFFWCARHPAEFKCQRRYTLLDEAVLIAADEAIVIGFFVGLYLYPRSCCNSADIVAERGLVQTLDFKILQRKQRKIHIHVEIGDDGPRDGRVRSKILRAELAFLFAGDRKK